MHSYSFAAPIASEQAEYLRNTTSRLSPVLLRYRKVFEADYSFRRRDQLCFVRERCSHPFVKFFQREVYLQRVPITFSLHRTRLILRQRLEQSKRDIHRLIVLSFRAGNVTRQRPNCTTRRRNQKFFAAH